MAPPDKLISSGPPTVARYGVALAGIAAALLLRWALTPLLHDRLPYLTLFGGIALAVWLGRWKPAVLGAVVGFPVSKYFFGNSGSPFVLDFGLVVELLGFCFSAGLIIWFGEAMHRARDRETLQTTLLSVTLQSIADAVIATDEEGRCTFMNAEAERLTGWSGAEGQGKPLNQLFRIINADTRKPGENPAEMVLRTGEARGLANHTILLSRDGTERPIDDSAAPIRQADGTLAGVVLVFRDISEQERSREAAVRLAAIVEFSGDAILTKSTEGIIRTWNTGAQQLFGYSSEEIVGKSVSILFPREKLTEEDHILERLRKGQPSEALETVRVAKNGTRIPVLASVSPLKDSEGNVIGASTIIHDLTELVRARDALAREQELLATTLASIGDGVIVTDPQGCVRFLNREAERLTGWESAEAAGRPLPEVFRILNEATRRDVENPVAKVLRLGQVVGLANHTILVARDGRETPIDDSAAPIRLPGGSLLGVVLVFRDFTEHKTSEKKLRELSLVAEQNPAPILRVSEGESLLYANPAALQTLHAWSLAIGVTVPAQISGLASEVLRSGQPVQRDLSVDGRDYLVSIVPIPEAGYANLYWNDVTESRRAAEALRDAHAELANRAGQLESLVQHRTARLNEMVGDLEAFSYSIVHDMRGPLRAMQSFARLLAEDCGPISPTAEDYVNRIERAATRMDRLIQDGLSYSRIMRSDLPLHPTDPGALLRGMLETYPAFQRPNADIEVHDPFPLVQANEAGLTQCVSNFLDNAVKFVADGDTPRVRVWAETRGDKVRLVFKDNGIGITKGAQDRIFHIFQRLNNAYEGTGIGLAIVKKAAERMGGTVGVESEPGQGSTFWLELPAVGPAGDGDPQGDGAKE